MAPNNHQPTLNYKDYTIGWVCALPLELASACAVLDRTHNPLPNDEGDNNVYSFGSIGHHNIVLVCLDQPGAVHTACAVTNLERSFPSIALQLVVGTAGGAPAKAKDLRLGDIVVGSKIVQYDCGKIDDGGKIERIPVRGHLNLILSNAVGLLGIAHEIEGSRVWDISGQALRDYPHMKELYRPPDPSKDMLFQADLKRRDRHSKHVNHNQCNRSNLIPRPGRSSQQPKIHYGGIASGNHFIRDSTTRDRLSEELNVICFEKESAGVIGECTWLVIRGISNFADSNTNEEWQRHAALMASSYTKELLQFITQNQHFKELKNAKEAALDQRDKRPTTMDKVDFENVIPRESVMSSVWQLIILSFAGVCIYLYKIIHFYLFHRRSPRTLALEQTRKQ